MMWSTDRLSARRIAGVAVIGFAAVVLLGVTPAAAQHRARLSRSLAGQIANGGSVRVVVQAPQAEVDRLA